MASILSSTNSIKDKIEEFKRFNELKRIKNMPPAPFQIPIGRIATYHVTDNDPGTNINEYQIILSRIRPKLQKLEIKCIVNGVAQDPPDYLGISALWRIHTTQWHLKQKLCYWHAVEPMLYFTHREFGQLRIVYSQARWNEINGDFALNFSVFEIATPDRNDSSSSENEDPGRSTVPEPTVLPFYKLF